jgi:hypothetical protein
MHTVAKWDVLELSFPGKTDGNPFTDYTIHGVFKSAVECVETCGFYDGDGVYRIRFMPSFEGEYRYRIDGSFSPDVTEGAFTVVAPPAGNHGPMRVNGCHFVYEDGTPYHEAGTTCYAWVHQSDERVQETLRTLSEGYFNKMRFCVFPKHYLYNLHEPATYPYEGTPCSTAGFDPEKDGMGILPGNRWDFTRFNPLHFRRIENAIQQLGELGIEADLIVMHPYDRWGFSAMSAEQDDLYWKYVIARFAAYRNVWWSLANEWDLMRAKTVADWERYAGLLVALDPYKHLRSIHNCLPFYDHNRPWITHASIQRQDTYKCAELTAEYRARYGKPVVLDEIAYEGNIDQGWGNISGKELVRRFWEATARGGYAGHGETFDRPDGVLWWSHGGALHGESPSRIRFLRRLLDETPGSGLAPYVASWDDVCARAENGTEYYLFYYGFYRPIRRTFRMSDKVTYRAEVIDTWEMTVQDAGPHTGTFTLELPGKEYIAVRLREEKA